MGTTPSKKEKSEGWLRFRAALPGKIKALPKRVGAWFSVHFKLEQGEGRRGAIAALKRPDFGLVLVLLLCALLPVSASLQTALYLGGAVLVVLLLGTLIGSLGRDCLTGALRRVVALCIALTLGTGAALVLSLHTDALGGAAGQFLPLLAVGCLFARPAPRARNSGGDLVAALTHGALFFASLVLLALVRDGLVGGIGGTRGGALLAGAACGGLLLFGVLSAFYRWLVGKLEKGRDPS